MKQFFVLLIGTFFGIVLVKSEVVSWFRIQKMFLFEEAHMYLIIASAVAVGAVAVYIIKRFQLKTVFNEDVAIKAKPYQKGVVIGGVLFGIGWAIITPLEPTMPLAPLTMTVSPGCRRALTTAP